ncbi:MAG: hypothetical protein IJ805_02700 [Lachnospiraceae bacterium]|nr:hypothetical protein [Lachnospiraceae bacterium]
MKAEPQAEQSKPFKADVARVTGSASAMEPAAVKEPAPVTESAAVKEPAPVMEPAAVKEPAPVTEPAAVKEPAPVTESAPVKGPAATEPEPVKESVAETKPAPATESIPAAETVSVTEPEPVIGTAETAQRAPAAEPVLVTESAPVADSVPMAEPAPFIAPAPAIMPEITENPVPSMPMTEFFADQKAGPAETFIEEPEISTATEIPRFDDLFEKRPVNTDNTPIYERNIYKAPPILSNQKPIARTSMPVMFDPEKADVLERAPRMDNRTLRPQGRSMQRNERGSADMRRAADTGALQEKKSARELLKEKKAAEKEAKLAAKKQRGLKPTQPQKQNVPGRTMPDNTGMMQRGSVGENRLPHGTLNTAMPAGTQNMGVTPGMAVNAGMPQNASATVQQTPVNQTYHPDTGNKAMERRASDKRASAGDRVVNNGTPNRPEHRNRDGSIKREERNRRATDSLLFGVVPRATMSLIFLILLIAATFISSLMLTDVAVPILIVIIVIEVVMGIALAGSPSFVCILLAMALTVVGAFTGFFIPVCIGNAIMLSANLVIKGE